MDVRLVPAGPEHAEVWLVWRREPRGLALNPVLDLDVNDLRKRLATSGSDLTDPAVAEYRWMVLVGEATVGTVALVGVSWPMGYGEIAYQIGESHQGRGIGRSAVGALIEKVFDETLLRRLTATIAVDNQPSRRLVESLGFVREGVLREHFLIGGEPMDEVVYGLLRSEWL